MLRKLKKPRKLHENFCENRKYKNKKKIRKLYFINKIREFGVIHSIKNPLNIHINKILRETTLGTVILKKHKNRDKIN